MIESGTVSRTTTPVTWATTSFRLSMCWTLRVVWTSIPASSRSMTSCQRFGCREPGRVRVRELVDEEELRPALRARPRGRNHAASCRGARPRSPAGAAAAEAVEERLGLGAPVRLDPPDDDVDRFLAERPRRLQHRVRLADAGRGAEEDLELALLPALLLLAAPQRAAPRDPADRRCASATLALSSSGRRRGRGSGGARSRGARRGGRAGAPRCAARRAGAPRPLPGCARAPRAVTWYSAAAGLMCGSRPLPEAVTRSTGTGAAASGSGGAERLDPGLDRLGQGGVRGPEVAPGGGLPRVGHRARRRGAAPEVARVVRVVERLAEQARSDHAAVLEHEASRSPDGGTRPARCRQAEQWRGRRTPARPVRTRRRGRGRSSGASEHGVLFLKGPQRGRGRRGADRRRAIPVPRTGRDEPRRGQ